MLWTGEQFHALNNGTLIWRYIEFIECVTSFIFNFGPSNLSMSTVASHTKKLRDSRQLPLRESNMNNTNNLFY